MSGGLRCTCLVPDTQVSRGSGDLSGLRSAGQLSLVEWRVVSSPLETDLKVRRATPEDAAGIVAVLAVVIDERVDSAIGRVWSVEQERRYLESLSAREVIHVAVDDADRVVGLQILDRWSAVLDSMAHVGQVGRSSYQPGGGEVSAGSCGTQPRPSRAKLGTKSSWSKCGAPTPTRSPSIAVLASPNAAACLGKS